MCEGEIVIQWHSMRFRLTVILLVISLLPLIFLGIFSYQRSASVIESETQELTNQLVGESNKILNQHLDEMVQVFTMLFTNQKLFDLLNTEKSDDAYENYQRESEIRDIMRNITNARLDIQAVTVASESGDLISTVSTLNADFQPEEQDWFKQTVDAEGKLVWFPTRQEALIGEGGEQWTYALARSVKAVGSDENYVFLLEVRESALSGLLKEMELNNTGALRIVDRNGNVVSSLDEGELGTKKETYTFLDQGEAGSFVESEQLISYAPLETSDWFLVAEVPLAAMLGQVKQIGIFTFGAVVLSAVASIIASVLIGRQLARPVEAMRGVMKLAGEGDLTAQAEITGKHEIAQLNNSYEELIRRFRNFVGRTKGAGEELKQAADDLIKQAEQNNVTYREITEATESIAAGADQQAREAETGAELVSELLSKWRASLSEAEKLEQVMNETVQVSEDGRNSIRDLLEKNELTEQEIKRLTDNLGLLEDRVGEVHKATNLIDDIMDQTKILALNAAIEAHRAGQDGRGFIVVADEIQRLSQQVLSATETIGGSIEAIQQAMKSTWNSMKLTNEAMELQRNTVTGTDQAFNSIREQMAEAQSQLTSVMNTLSLVQQFEQKMSDAIQNISAVAQQSAAATEQVAALAKDQENSSDHLVTLSHSLAEVVNTLEEELSQFRVDSEAAGDDGAETAEGRRLAREGENADDTSPFDKSKASANTVEEEERAVGEGYSEFAEEGGREEGDTLTEEETESVYESDPGSETEGERQDDEKREDSSN